VGANSVSVHFPFFDNDLHTRSFFAIGSDLRGWHLVGYFPVKDVAATVDSSDNVLFFIAQGVATNMAGTEQSVTLDGGGILDYCRVNRITVQAWSPFQAGFFTGVFLDSPDYPELNAVIDRLAKSYDVLPIAIATAWITRHPANMQVVLGTTNPQRVTAAAAGSDIPLTRAEWYELYRAAAHASSMERSNHA